MRNAQTLWQTAFLAAVSAFAIEFVDCLLAGCGVGAVNLALRVSPWSVVVAIILLYASEVLSAGRPGKAHFAALLALAIPLAISSGNHLSTTATAIRLIGYKYRVVMPIALMATIYASYFWLLYRLYKLTEAKVGHRLLGGGISLSSALALFVCAVYLKKLHYPLALAALFFCWLNLQISGRIGIGMLPYRVARAGAASLVFMGIGMMLWPISLEDTFAASDQGIFARDLTSIGRAHTMDELVEQTAPLKHVPRSIVPPAAILPHFPGSSVVLITVDALRPDHLGFYGYKRKLSPNIDTLLKDSVVFDHAYSTAPTSSFSIPSIHTGVPMEQHLKSGAPVPPLLAALLAKLGYTTIGLYPPKVFSVGPSLMGEIEKSRFGFQHTELLQMDAQKDVQTALTHLHQHQTSQPLFLWVHLYDPHLPYTCHDSSLGRSQEECYDSEIRYLDGHLARLLDEVDRLLNKPVIVFTADHGEAFGEHGRFYHSTDLYDEQVRVPLAFRLQDVSPRRVKTPVSNASIADTIISLVQPESAAQDDDLRPFMVSEAAPRPVISTIGMKRAVIFNQHKLICEKWPTGACALFNLNRDPAETNNIAGKDVGNTVAMLGLLKDAANHELAELRKTAPEAIILGRLKRPEAILGLISITQNEDSPHVVEATRLLALLRQQSVEVHLKKLSMSQKPKVAAWGTIGIALLGESFSQDALYPYLSQTSELGYWSAIALGQNQDPKALSVLVQLLKHDEPEFRAQAALALGKLGDPHAVPALISLLQIKQSRWAAIEALGRLADRRALPILLSLRKKEPDISNLPRYEKAIAQIESN
ncbi:MAG: sulfatase-like hydrolase/transferase [Deltaproteobacteria bacterium]|nr:sulfatase-like hydrolase/transferase [Deltaproteobacteria bacterium]